MRWLDRTICWVADHPWKFILLLLAFYLIIDLSRMAMAEPHEDCDCDPDLVAYALPDIAGGPGCGYTGCDWMDGDVDILDMVELFMRWGPCPVDLQCCRGDIDQDGEVGISDLLLLLGHWGQPPWTFQRCHPL